MNGAYCMTLPLSHSFCNIQQCRRDLLHRLGLAVLYRFYFIRVANKRLLRLRHVASSVTSESHLSMTCCIRVGALHLSVGTDGMPGAPFSFCPQHGALHLSFLGKRGSESPDVIA